MLYLLMNSCKCPSYPIKPNQQKRAKSPDACRCHHKKIIKKINNDMGWLAAVPSHRQEGDHLLLGTKAYLSKDTLKLI